MTGYNSQVGEGRYKIQYETDIKENYTEIENKIREQIDKKQTMKTHREQINNMSNEELAEFIITQDMCNICAVDKENCGTPNLKPCIKGLTKWLNMEVEE